jgi:ABC-type branched-subunit amino acid transport system permease subunit
LRITTAPQLTQVSSLPPEYVATYDLTTRYELAGPGRGARARWCGGCCAVREDEEAAEASGVSSLHKLVALALSSLFAGLAGGVFAFYHISYYPEMTFSATWTFDAVLPVYVGGIGTLWGPVIGTALYVVVREQLARSPCKHTR